MNKIKNFRLALNKNVAWRQLRSKLELDMPEDDRLFFELFEEFEKVCAPSAIYDTVSRESLEHDFTLLWNDCMSLINANAAEEIPNKHVLAMSFAIVTLGEGAQTLLKARAADPKSALIIRAIAHHSLGLAVNFITRLLSDEAEQEHCAVPVKFEIAHNSYCNIIQRILEPDKIGVKISEQQPLAPEFTGFYCVPWMKKKKK